MQFFLQSIELEMQKSRFNKKIKMQMQEKEK